MHVNNYPRVRTLMGARNALLTDIETVSGAKGLAVTIGGRYQGEEIVGRVRQVVLEHLRRQVDGVESELASLGVEVEP